MSNTTYKRLDENGLSHLVGKIKSVSDSKLQMVSLNNMDEYNALTQNEKMNPGLLFEIKEHQGGGGGSSTAGGSKIVITTLDESLEGIEITASKSGYTKSSVFSDGIAIIDGFEEVGDVTLSVLIDGDSVSKTIIVPYYSKYYVTFELKTFYQKWVEVVGKNSDNYVTLSDITSDEKLVRELFTRHISVDYLKTNSMEPEIEDIINDDICAKWINLRDYALDTLYSDATIADFMDEADKYFYGEWALMPQVPVMTSNTAPYGTASASSYITSSGIPFDAWRAFDGSISPISGGYYDSWLPNHNATNNWVKYQFTSPVKINKCRITLFDNDNTPSRTFIIQASNNDSDWTDIESLTFDNGTINDLSTKEITFQNNTEYQYYRLFCADPLHYSGQYALWICAVQFYAWQPKGNVPVMTSNSAPYGTASASTMFSQSQAYWAFDDVLNEMTFASGSSPVFLQYGGNRPLLNKKAKITFSIYSQGAAAPSIGFKIQASNNVSDWTDVSELITMPQQAQGYGNLTHFVDQEVSLTTEQYYLYYRYYSTDSHHSQNNWAWNITSLQFYGRELKSAIPQMTSDNTPFTQSSASSTYNTASGDYSYFGPYTSFNKTYEGWGWFSGIGAQTNQYMTLMFKRSIPTVKKCVLYCINAYNGTVLKVMGSNDGTNWTDIVSFDNIVNDSSATRIYDKDFTANYKYYRFYYTAAGTVPNHQGVAGSMCISEIELFTVNYSEYDWDEDYPRHYIYDHGLNLETLTMTGSATDEPDGSIKLSAASSSAKATVDTTNFTLLRGDMGLYGSGTNALVCGNGSVNYAVANLPYNTYLDITSINSNNATGVNQSAAGVFTAEEIWIE